MQCFALFANKLSIIEKQSIFDGTFPRDDMPSLDRIYLAKDGDSFGQRLKNWREHNHFTQEYVANLIYNFRMDHGIEKTSKGSRFTPEKDSVLRTYQNWEAKKNDKDIRISMADLFTLKSITGCTYEYLCGESNYIESRCDNLYKIIGLNPQNINKLELYSQSLQESVNRVPPYARNILSTIDLIVSDNELLSFLLYYLSDMPFDANMRQCSILKPIKLHTNIVDLHCSAEDGYYDYLYPKDNEMRNVFLPAIFTCLKNLRKKNLFNHQPIIDHIDEETKKSKSVKNNKK